MLHIARMYYPVTTLGPGRRVGIWTAGCNRGCPGCLSPELQDPAHGRAMTPEDVLEVLRALPERPEGFTLSGGEPFADPAGLCELLHALSSISDDILVFTGYTGQELETLEGAGEAVSLCAALVEGPYIQALNEGIGLRGSRNQRCRVFRYPERYAGMERWPREVQTVRYGDGFLAIGIP